jgi:hypothetical protein
LAIAVPAGTPASTRVTRVIVALAPLAIVPKLQVTVPVPLHDPCDGVAETNVSPDGSTSVTTAAVALLGPALLTASV